jgi:hypothetical protein
MRRRRSNAISPDRNLWWNSEPGSVNRVLLPYVWQLERDQFDVFTRFLQLEHLYDPNCRSASNYEDVEGIGMAIENVVASNVDTVHAAIAATEVRARFMTDDAEWSVQRTATMLEWYAEGLGKLLDLHKHASKAFKQSAKKGVGLLKVFADAFDRVRVENVMIDNIIVDDAECRDGGTPRQMHHRMLNADPEELKARFPDKVSEIDQATGRMQDLHRWAGYRPVDRFGVVVVESWRLPIGVSGMEGYRAGRHTIVIDGCDLLDEEWEDDFFPFAVFSWSERDTSFYAISLAERIAGIQRALNKRNWQIDRNLDQYAVPTTYVDMADANLQVQSISRLGTVAIIRGRPPTTVTPQANSPEVYQHREQLKGSAFEESGVSRLAASATKPAGIESAVGLREYRDQTTQRFAPQEKMFETGVLDTFILVLWICKQLGPRAPEISRPAKYGERKIRWKDVSRDTLRVQIAAASTLSRSPAGRAQTALEWAQAGVISTDEWRRLTKHPDLDHVLSLYTQGMESVERDLEAIVFDDLTVVPEPFGNLQLMSRMGQAAYLKYRDLNVPSETLEALRTYTVLAAHLFAQATAPGAAMPPGAPGSLPPGAELTPTGAPGMPPGPPNPMAPSSAFAPQAMQLLPSAG